MFDIRRYISPVIAIVLCAAALMILHELGFDRIEHTVITLEPKDETSIQYAVEEKHSAPVSSVFGLGTRMSYYVTYTDSGETKSAIVEENVYHKITDTIYMTSTTQLNPPILMIFAIQAAALIAVIIFIAGDLSSARYIEREANCT